jgi:hypothetical protein
MALPVAIADRFSLRGVRQPRGWENYAAAAANLAARGWSAAAAVLAFRVRHGGGPSLASAMGADRAWRPPWRRTEFFGVDPKKVRLFLPVLRSRLGTAGARRFVSDSSTRCNSNAKRNFGKARSQAELGYEGSNEMRELLRNTFFGSSPKKSSFFSAPKKPKKSRPQLTDAAEVHGFLAVGAEDVGVGGAGHFEELVVENADHALESADCALQVEFGRPEGAVNVQQNR